MKKSAMRIICFLLILILLLYGTGSILKFKNGDGIYSLTKFYELEDNTVDVLVLGSSHAFENFNTGLLWDKYGMSAYVLGGSIQPMWNSYYYLKEALKTQAPDLVILEGYMLHSSADYSDDSRIIKNTYGMKWSADRIAAIQVSSPEERWSEFIPDYIQYHTRYAELSGADFLPNQGNPLYENFKGFGCNTATEAFDAPDVSGVLSATDLNKKTETYYRNIIDLCETEGIPLLIVISPYAAITENDQARYLAGEAIANEYGVDFINYNLMYDELGLNFQKDMADDNHLNHNGNRKFSRTVGAYIHDNYEIKDHRGDPDYQSWQANADYIRAMIENQQLLETTEPVALPEKLQNSRYRLFISLDGSQSLEDAVLLSLLNELGISNGDEGQLWYKDNAAGELSVVSDTLYMDLQKNDCYLEHRADAETAQWQNTVMINGTVYQEADNGINITVYDTVTQKVVDSVGIDAEDEYQIIR